MSVVCKISLVLVCCAGIFSCREKLPVDGQSGSPQVFFAMTKGAYYRFDNWALDIFGQRIPNSYFRNSWTVVDTGRVFHGASRVVLVVDSTFDSSNRFVGTDSLFFRTASNGDVYRWGFLKALIAERETLQLEAQWDRIAAFSQGLGSSWVIARIDTSNGAEGNETIFGSVAASATYFGPLRIDGTQRTIIAYRVEITKPRMYYAFWITDSPASIARMLDDSDILRNATLRELQSITLH